MARRRRPGGAGKTAVNTVNLRPKPQMRLLREGVGEGDAESRPTSPPGRNWTIQIGAYADQTLAKAQLAAYSGKAQGRAGARHKIVAPITRQTATRSIAPASAPMPSGRRATSAAQLTQRGQTCFAVVTR